MNRFHDVQEVLQALECVVLRLHRDDHGIRGDEAVDREQAERWRAVDEDVVIRVARAVFERLTKCVLTPHRVEEVYLRRGKVKRGGSHVDPREVAVHDDGGEGALLGDEDVRRGAGDICEVEAEPRGQVRLSVHINGEDLEATLSERSCEIDDCRRLSDAALLVGDRNDLPHETPSASAGGVPPSAPSASYPLVFVRSSACARCLRARTAHRHPVRVGRG